RPLPWPGHTTTTEDPSMPARIPPVEIANAPDKSRAVLEPIAAKRPFVPNFLKTIAHSPAVLQAYMDFSGAMKGCTLDAATRERIALSLGQTNGCDYCLSAHAAAGKASGLSDADVAA